MTAIGRQPDAARARRSYTGRAVKLEELECFLEVAKQGNMTVASKVLHLAQSTVSERIQQLEANLGVSLFERSARERRLALTAAGKRLQVVAGRLASVAEDIRAEGRSGESRSKPVRIGVNESVAYAWLGGWLARVRLSQPELAFDLKVGTTDELDVMMVGGALDLAIGTRGFGYRAIERRQLAALPMVFVGSAARHDRPEYSLQELAAEGLITFQARSLQAQSLHDMLRAECIAQCRVDTVSSIAMIVRLVEDGGGVATLPRGLVERANNPRLRILRCSTQLEPLPLWLSWRPQRNNRAVAEALAMLLAFLGELSPNDRARAAYKHR
jgi:DNA-binding transcriptional LysR family regulator